jgi:anti-sigma regulatory factor (Ser/Thr protein kinase)
MLDLTVPADPSVLQGIRRSLRGVARDLGINPDKSEELQVAVGEAMSNAIEHAYDSDPGTIHLQVRRDDARLVVEVEDRGRWRPRRPGRQGYGLRLMRTLMDGMSVDTTATGTTIRLTLTLENGFADRPSRKY